MHRDWIVAQIGAREHYAVPRALHRRGLLYRLYTDTWCKGGRSLLRRMPEPVRSFANRFHPELSSADVTAFNKQAIWRAIRERVNEVQPYTEEYYRHHMEVGATFGRNVRNYLTRSLKNFEGNVFFGYNTGCLEVLRALEGTSCLTIVDQIDPGRLEKEIVIEEVKNWPNWTMQSPVIYAPYQDRLREEWTTATTVVVNSRWSKDALIQQGVDGKKIEVVPLAYDPGDTIPGCKKRSSNETLKVLWLGSVILRKGIQYLVQAARLLEHEPVTFKIVGPVGITEKAIASAPSNIKFTGPVARHESSNEYSDAHIFVLPTLSDGFAITQLEAMAHGLPVIATPNCGRVVTDDKDGFVIPPRDPQALAESIMRFVDNESLVEEMSHHARAKANTFTLERVADRLIEVFDQHRGID